jgi:S1-C subfamily serine protease
MKRLLLVPFILILLGASALFSDTKTVEKVVVSSKDSQEGFLGVYLGKLTDDIAKEKGYTGENGVLIIGIVDDSPADDAGLKSGDIVIEANGKPVSSSDDLEEIIEKTGAGNELTLKIFRDNQEKTLTATLVEDNENFSNYRRILNLGSPELGLSLGKEGSKYFISAFSRGKLGVKVQELNEQLAKYFKVDEGVLITEVIKDRPADKAGLEAGDVITTVAGKSVEDPEDLQKSLKKYEAGDKVDITYVRQGTTNTVQVELDNPSEKLYTYRGYLGVNLQDLTPQLKTFFKVDNGVLVTEVVAESPAEKAGFKAGDVIIRLADQTIESAADLTKAVRDHKPGDKVDVVIIRDKKQKTINVELGKTKEKEFNVKIFGDDDKNLDIYLNPQEMREDLDDALKNIRVKVNPNIELQEYYKNMDDANQEISNQTGLLDRQLQKLQNIEIQKYLDNGTEYLQHLMDNLHNQMERLHSQMTKLQDELKRLEIEKKLKEQI